MRYFKISIQNKIGINLLLFLFIVIFSLKIGLETFSFQQLFNLIFNYNKNNEHNFIIFDIRLPRIIIGAICGSLFAISGSILQTIFKNPMAAPDILGINSACSFAILFYFIFLQKILQIPLILISFFGASIAFCIAISSVIQNKKINQLRLVIIGIAIGVLFYSLCQFLIMQSDEKISSFVKFLTGTLYNSSWNIINEIYLLSFIFIFITYFFHKKLDFFVLSDETTNSLGFSNFKWKIIFIFISLSLASIAVAGCGSLGFIGLISPNISKIIYGYKHRYNLIGSAFIGANLTLISDLLGRIIFPPYEIPVGLITIILGVPYFIFLMWKINRAYI